MFYVLCFMFLLFKIIDLHVKGGFDRQAVKLLAGLKPRFLSPLSGSRPLTGWVHITTAIYL
jgi:hypothetical protein